MAKHEGPWLQPDGVGLVRNDGYPEALTSAWGKKYTLVKWAGWRALLSSFLLAVGVGLGEDVDIPRSGAHRPGFCLCQPRWPRLQAKVGIHLGAGNHPQAPPPKTYGGCKAASRCQRHRQGWASWKASLENGADAEKHSHPTLPAPHPTLPHPTLACLTPEAPRKCEMEGGTCQALGGPFCSPASLPRKHGSTPWLACLTEGDAVFAGSVGFCPSGPRPAHLPSQCHALLGTTGIWRPYSMVLG